MKKYSILSADDHVFEPSDLWITRMDAKYRDRAPRLVHEETMDIWQCEDLPLVTLSPGTHPGRRCEEDLEKKAELGQRTREEDIRPGGYDPHERIKDMDLDGVDITIIYPTVGFHCYRVADNELLNGIQRTYNDWIAEYCSAVPGRLNGIALINTDEVDNAIKEMERCKKMGLVGVMISAYPGPGKRYVNADYEPFWAAAEDLRMPLALHIGTNRPGPDNEFMNLGSLTSAFLTNVDHYVRMSIADMVFTGVFERHPNLYAGSIEQKSAWVPHFLERMDFTYLERRGAGSRRDRFEFKDDKVPSDFWYSNMFVGFQEDAMGVQMKDVIGVDNIQFGADYPHDEGTFPKTQEIVDRILAGCTDEERHKILWGNAARVYDIH